MTARLGRWEIRTNPVKQAAGDRAPEYLILRKSHPAPFIEPDLEEMVGDFITRQVLERDSQLHEG